MKTPSISQPLGRPWWLIGTIISLVLGFVLRFLLGTWYETILKTSPDGNADLGLVILYFIGTSIIGVVLISFLIGAVVQWRRGLRQFTKKRVSILIIVLFLAFFVGNRLKDHFFPVQSKTNISACSKIVNNVLRDGCFKDVCFAENRNNRDNGIGESRCILTASIQYDNPGSCSYIDSGKEYCSCYYSFTKLGTLHGQLKDFVDNGGDCSIYSNREKDNAACYAVKEVNESYCLNLKN
mgnify:CR=1 FL=1